jgi:hypothetical protein
MEYRLEVDAKFIGGPLSQWVYIYEKLTPSV